MKLGIREFSKRGNCVVILAIVGNSCFQVFNYATLGMTSSVRSSNDR